MDKTLSIQNIELKLRINLERIESIDSFAPGYVVENEKIIGLSLYGCKVNDLSAIGADLIDLKLRQLNLRYSEVSNISFLENLKELEHLNLRGNAISNITILSGLKELIRLNLSFNSIENINPLIHLKKIRLLDIRNNRIEVLPPWIIEFNGHAVFQESEIVFEENVDTNNFILLNDNPLKSPPPEIITQGPDAIGRYFEQIKDEGVDYIYEAKLILVGEGNAGKTSLQIRLRDSMASLPASESRTRGIKVEEWIFKEQEGNKHIAHIWDFGGQDVYYPVHRFFLTENSVFVLLASTRQSHHNFDYWIPTIYQFGGQSPIIIGQTRHDGNMTSWNELEYFLSNPIFNIVKTKKQPYYELNLPDNNYGLVEIENVIINQLTGLSHYGKGVPKSWVSIREKIFEETKRNHYISFEKFGQVCREINPAVFNDSEIIQDCAKFMHAIGVLLWYSNNETLKEWVILQPEWAMNAVYKIIDDAKIQDQHGNITGHDFERLWIGTYNGKHTILKKMLEEFKIAFPKKDHRGEYILPARLSSLPPDYKWGGNEPAIQIEYHYDFMPKGLVNQLSAELSKYIPNEHEVWNNAVNFTDDSRRSFCQVEEDFFFRKITLKAKGKDSRALMLIVMGVMSDITRSYKGVKPKITVPCRCEICIDSNNPTRFLYQDLIKWSAMKEKVYCNEGDVFLPIDELLRYVGLQQIQQTGNKIIKIFLASSSELESDRREFEIFVNRENKRLIKTGTFIELIIWEDFIDAMSKERLQNEYNNAVRDCDIFVSLFFSKVGKYTKEEFQVAFGHFIDTKKPLVYTYFKNGQINIQEIKEEDIQSKFEFQKELKSLGHFPTSYSDINDLKVQFKSQLDKILPNIVN